MQFHLPIPNPFLHKRLNVQCICVKSFSPIAHHRLYSHCGHFAIEARLGWLGAETACTIDTSNFMQVHCSNIGPTTPCFNFKMATA